MHQEEEETKGKKIKDISTFNLKEKIPTIKCRNFQTIEST